MSIFIDEGELIVGNQSSALRAAPIFPEYVTAWIINELDEFDKRPGDAFYVTEEQKKELREICTWWEGKTLIEKGNSLMSPLNREIHDSGIIRAEGNLTSGDAHIAVNFEKILKIGLAGYLNEIETAAKITENNDTDFAKKQNFYKSLKTGIESFQEFIKRYEKLALELFRPGNRYSKKRRASPDKQKLQVIFHTIHLRISMKPFSLPGLFSWYCRLKAMAIPFHSGEWISTCGSFIKMTWQQEELMKTLLLSFSKIHGSNCCRLIRSDRGRIQGSQQAALFIKMLRLEVRQPTERMQ